MKKTILISTLFLFLALSLQSCGKSGNVLDRVLTLFGSDKETVDDATTTTDVDTVDIVNTIEETVKTAPIAENQKTERRNTDVVTLTGKIGGKYAIVMTLNLLRETGSYYYVKSGANNSLDLEWIEYDPSTGHLVMDEYTASGNNSGNFNGHLTGLETGHIKYTGYMITAQGKEFAFTLTEE